ncbi:Uncharacterized protein AXF42_Ash002741 [Apostasia shenzhenica]|uniref:O-fucosyltransferase family protein n=1 Tax=Apostasia shenzhenica TaxID=1088818 RepID=A0A2I0A758_9ASPA|nr:Uncharacterized protein AXF42_Ash002741 [Apostasia shenzhenica]
MAVDPRHILAGFLTISMFAMLGNMIKRDHFDSLQMTLPLQSGVNVMKFEENKFSIASLVTKNPWKEDGQQLKPCWAKPLSKAEERSNGYIVFSLTKGLEYHVSQLADAVVIARYLGATLMLPDIRGREPSQKRKFEDMYDADKFLRSLNGVIKIVKELPPDVASRNPAIVRVPNQVYEDFIVKSIEPIFRAMGYLRLSIDFPSRNSKQTEKQNPDLHATSCLTTFESLELKPEVQEVADTMTRKLRTIGRNSDGCFIAVDLRIEILEMKICKQIGNKGKKNCYNAEEISDFLRKMGFLGNTTIYLTQTWWHESLNLFREVFPNTYTKDDLIPADKKGDYLKHGNTHLEQALDLYICSQSNAFVPAISGLFYGVVAGKRIASGRSQILDPSSPPPDFISSYFSRKSHLAYSCHC